MELRSPGTAPLLADLVDVEVGVLPLVTDASVGLPASVLDPVLDGAAVPDELDVVFPALMALFWN